MKEVLIVCRGNTCRSPMAMALYADMLRSRGHDDRVLVTSAGIWASKGQPATDDAQRAMRERGLDVSGHRACYLSRADVQRADLLIPLEEGIAEALRIESSEAADKIITLGQLADQPGDVEDPIGRTIEEYRRTADLLQSLLQRAYGTILAILGVPL